MEKHDSLERQGLSEIENSRSRRLKRSLSISEISRSLVEGLVNDLDQEELEEESGNKAPIKKQHRSVPIKFSPTSEADKEMPILNLGSPYFEAETIYAHSSGDEVMQLFNSPGPRAPIRQASKGSLMEEFGIDGEVMESSSARVALYFDQEQEGSTNFLNDEVKKENSPSLSPRAKNLPIETFKIDSKMRE